MEEQLKIDCSAPRGGRSEKKGGTKRAAKPVLNSTSALLSLSTHAHISLISGGLKKKKKKKKKKVMKLTDMPTPFSVFLLLCKEWPQRASLQKLSVHPIISEIAFSPLPWFFIIQYLNGKALLVLYSTELTEMMQVDDYQLQLAYKVFHSFTSNPSLLQKLIPLPLCWLWLPYLSVTTPSLQFYNENMRKSIECCIFVDLCHMTNAINYSKKVPDVKPCRTPAMLEITSVGRQSKKLIKQHMKPTTNWADWWQMEAVCIQWQLHPYKSPTCHHLALKALTSYMSW